MNGRLRAGRLLAFCVVLLLATTGLASSLRRPFEVRCEGLETLHIRGTYNVDWGWGTLESARDGLRLGLYVGPLTEMLIPERRPPGFRWLKEEKIGRTVLRYGLNVYENQMQATIVGKPVFTQINLAGDPKKADRFVAVVRALAAAKCEYSKS